MVGKGCFRFVLKLTSSCPLHVEEREMIAETRKSSIFFPGFTLSPTCTPLQSSVESVSSIVFRPTFLDDLLFCTVRASFGSSPCCGTTTVPCVLEQLLLFLQFNFCEFLQILCFHASTTMSSVALLCSSRMLRSSWRFTTIASSFGAYETRSEAFNKPRVPRRR